MSITSSAGGCPTQCAKARIAADIPTGRKTHQGHTDKYSNIIYFMKARGYECINDLKRSMNSLYGEKSNVTRVLRSDEVLRYRYGESPRTGSVV